MRKLSLKEKGFCEDYVATKGNGTEAVVRNYNVKNRASASTLSSIKLRKPEIQGEIEDLMDKHRITDDFLMKKLKEGLESNVVSVFKGEVEETEVADQNARHKFFQDAAKMKGWVKEETNVNIANIDLEVERMSDEEVKEALKQIFNEHPKRRQIKAAGEVQG